MDAHNEFLQDKMCVGSHKHFLVNLRPNADKMAKKRKTFFYDRNLELYFTTINDLGQQSC